MGGGMGQGSGGEYNDGRGTQRLGIDGRSSGEGPVGLDKPGELPAEPPDRYLSNALDENPPEPPDSDDESFIRFETNSKHDYERLSLKEQPIEVELQTIHVSIDEDEKTPEWLEFEQEHADDFEQMQILQSFQMQADPPKTGHNYWLYDPQVTRLTAAWDQPVRDVKMMQPITIEVKLNGVPCYVLVDTGRNTNSFRPITARIVNADRIDLKEQVQLQLGTKRSRTKINYGTRVNVHVGPINESVYFDIVDIDHYDAILGMPFLTKYSAVVNLGK
ncbi:hypothetical protein LXA43DRAFT_1068480 [Ganoderma leucocontextum]|nr:hypothetical protein LXA43DRAFT_1068480 [Ganoderma leucocontextum]